MAKVCLKKRKKSYTIKLSKVYSFDSLIFLSNGKETPLRNRREKMAFTRKMLEALGVDSKAIEQIIEAHTEVTDALKAERDNYKASADTLESVQKELNDLRAKNSEDWESKYNTAVSELNDFKSSVANEKTLAAKKAAYRKLAEKIGISNQKILDLILKTTDFEKIELNGDEISDADEISSKIETEYADFISSSEERGSEVERIKRQGNDTPLDKLDMAAYIKARTGK